MTETLTTEQVEAIVAFAAEIEWLEPRVAMDPRFSAGVSSLATELLALRKRVGELEGAGWQMLDLLKRVVAVLDAEVFDELAADPLLRDAVTFLYTAKEPNGWQDIATAPRNARDNTTDQLHAAEANAARMREALKAGGGTAVTEDGVVLTIQISGSTLAHAVKYMPNAEIFDKGLQDFFQPEVVDEAAFLKEMANALQHEEEDGTTLVHRMLDEAAIHIMHVGGDGVLSAQEVRDRARASLSNTSEGGERNGD